MRSGQGLCARGGCARGGSAGCRGARLTQPPLPLPAATAAATSAAGIIGVPQHSSGWVARCALTGTKPAAAWRQPNGQGTCQAGARSPPRGTTWHRPGSLGAATWAQPALRTQYGRRTDPEWAAVCRSAAGGGGGGPALRPRSRSASERATKPAAAVVTPGCTSTSTPSRGPTANNLSTSMTKNTGTAARTSSSAFPCPSYDSQSARHAVGSMRCVPNNSSTAHEGGSSQGGTTAAQQQQQQAALQHGNLEQGRVQQRGEHPQQGAQSQAGHMRPGGTCHQQQQHEQHQPQRMEGNGAGALGPVPCGLRYQGQQDLEQQQQHGVRQYDDDDKIGRALKEAAARRERLAEALHGGRAVRVVVDCGFVHTLTSHKELRSLIKQISSAMVHNREATAPVSLQVTSWRGELAAYAEGAMGAAAWPLVKHTQSTLEVYDPSQYDIVVLSPDAEEPLLDLDERCVYVVGGIVDRTVRKGVTSSYAAGQGLRARRLPTVEFAEQLGLGNGVSTRPVLNICDVVLALLRLRANGGDWPDALDAAIPRRKRAAAAAARAGAGVAAAGVGPVGAAGAGAAAGRGPTPAAAPASAAAAALTSDQ